MINSVLLVDDNRIDQKLCRRLMSRSGQVGRFHGCFNGREALDYLADEPVDLLLVDVNMPGQSGFEMLRQAHLEIPSRLARATVVMLSSSIAAEDRREAAEMGFVSCFIEKPLTASHLPELQSMMQNSEGK